MNINLVVAASENNVIGKDNQLVWNLPNDMKFFKNITWAMPVIMGRKTYEALGKPLNGRTNIVITRNTSWNAEGVKVVKSLEQALVAASETDSKEAFIIGGGQIFEQSMSIAQRIYITRVHAELEGDAYFPVIDDSWKLVSTLDFPADEKHAYAYTFETWTKSN
jgi:dihydrofolate reductase